MSLVAQQNTHFTFLLFVRVELHHVARIAIRSMYWDGDVGIAMITWVSLYALICGSTTAGKIIGSFITNSLSLYGLEAIIFSAES